MCCIQLYVYSYIFFFWGHKNMKEGEVVAVKKINKFQTMGGFLQQEEGSWSQLKEWWMDLNIQQSPNVVRQAQMFLFQQKEDLNMQPEFQWTDLDQSVFMYWNGPVKVQIWISVHVWTNLLVCGMKWCLEDFLFISSSSPSVIARNFIMNFKCFLYVLLSWCSMKVFFWVYFPIFKS